MDGGLEPSSQNSAQIKVLVLDIVAKKDGATFHLSFWIIEGEFAAFLVAKLDNASKVDCLACCVGGVPHR